MEKIQSIYENAFMTCKKCGKVTSNHKEREKHICQEDQVTARLTSARCFKLYNERVNL